MRMRGYWVVIGSLLASCWPQGAAHGQGFMADRHRGPTAVPVARAFEIREVAIDARVHEQVAEVLVSQTFHNPGSVAIDAEYLFPLPEDAGIQNLVLMVDGQELAGKLLPKEEARRIYEEIVRSKRDPALLEYMGRGLFRTSVFPIPAGADRKVTLRYTQLCRRERDVVEFLYPLGTQKFTAKPIQKLFLNVRIDGRAAIKSIYTPSHDVKVQRLGEREANLSLDARDAVPATDFRLYFTLAEGTVGATVLSYRPSAGEDGYFLLLASPQVKLPEAKPLPKTVVFVIDRSGSMAGKKIEQARNALQSVLNNLRDDDTFNIVAYDERVETFKPELQRYSPSSRAEAERFVANIREGGSTNIDGGLKSALGMITDESRPGYVLFLTDGLPTAGERNELRIAANGKASNKAHARIFSFGVGFDVNARLLDRLSGGNGGTSEYVRPDEDIEAHVGAFYSKITRPALAGIGVELAGTDVNRTYPRDIPDLFEGGQLVWVGRYRQSGKTTIKLTGKVGGEARSFEFPAELASAGSSTSLDFVEKLWAIRRVGSIIDQIDLDGPNKELTDELVALSAKYGLLTPYTSFLADDRVQLHAGVANGGRATGELAALKEVQGPSGVSQRMVKQSLAQATKPGDATQPFNAIPSTNQPGVGSAGGRGGTGGAGNFGGGMGGMGGQPAEKAKAAASPKSGQATASALFATPDQQVLDEKLGREPSTNVRQLGAKTFFYKANRWVDSEVKPEDEAKAVALEQFSDDFFKFAGTQNAEQNQYLSFDEPVTVAIGGKVYKVDPPKTK